MPIELAPGDALAPQRRIIDERVAGGQPFHCDEMVEIPKGDKGDTEFIGPRGGNFESFGVKVEAPRGAHDVAGTAAVARDAALNA